MSFADALFELAEYTHQIAEDAGAGARIVLQVSRDAFDRVEQDRMLFEERSGPVRFAPAGDGSPVKQLPLFDGLVVVECPAQVNRSRVGSGSFTMDLS